MALCVSQPAMTPSIFKGCGASVHRGDVQHWWLPTPARDKERVSDSEFGFPSSWRTILMSRDTAVLEEQVPFLGGGPLAPDALRFLGPRGRSGCVV